MPASTIRLQCADVTARTWASATAGGPVRGEVVGAVGSDAEAEVVGGPLESVAVEAPSVDVESVQPPSSNTPAAKHTPKARRRRAGVPMGNGNRAAAPTIRLLANDPPVAPFPL